MGRKAQKSAFGAALLTAGLLLENACEAVGPMDCDTDLPALRVVNPDSLLMAPHSLCFYSIRSDGNGLFCPQDFSMNISASDSANALIHLDTSGLGLYVSGARINVPRPGYVPASYWRNCPVYQEMGGIYVQGMLSTVMDTTVSVEIRRDSLAVRSWNVRYHFDTSQVPLFTISNTTDGLAAQINLRTGVSPREVWFRSEGAMHPSLAFPSGSPSFTVAIRFRDVSFLNYSTDSAAMNQNNIYFCADFDSSAHTIYVNGAARGARSETCSRVEGSNYDWLMQYWRRYCWNCR